LNKLAYEQYIAITC